MTDLILWDVDHTLVDSDGTSKLNYRLAFKLLADVEPEVGPETNGRTDTAIMANLLAANGVEGRWSPRQQLDALARAGEENRALMASSGHALPGAENLLCALQNDPTVLSSVLTGNIEPNAQVKLGVFGLDRFIDWSCGAFGSESEVRADLVAVAQAKAARLHGFDPLVDTTVLVGDTRRDVEAALAGGARVVGVATGAESVGDLLDAGADRVLADLADLQASLEALSFARSLGPGAGLGCGVPTRTKPARTSGDTGRPGRQGLGRGGSVPGSHGRRGRAC
jgi:phosphoglycolate phosphatase